MKIIIYGIIYGIFAGILHATIAVLPFVGVKELGMSTQFFGSIFCLTYIGYFLGSLIAGKLSEKVNTNNSLLIGILLTLLGNSILIINAITGNISISVLFSSIFMIFLGMPFIFVNASVQAVSSHYDKAIASSVLNFISITIACLGSFASGAITSSFVLNLSILIYVMLSISSFALVLSSSGIKILRVFQVQKNYKNISPILK